MHGALQVMERKARSELQHNLGVDGVLKCRPQRYPRNPSAVADAMLMMPLPHDRNTFGMS
jgi:hypothetical protein